MFFSYLHNYKYKYKYFIALFVAIFVAIVTWFTLFANNSIETFKPLQPKSLEEGEIFYPCDNFCGPKGQCAITREQCVENSECSHCINESLREGFSSINTNANTSKSLQMYKSPETSSLTTDISNFATVIENEKGSTVPKMNLGVDLWTKAFNYGLKLEQSKLNYDFVLYPGELENKPNYKTTETATGMFNDIGPTAANADL
jgi:hypothetical protein